jgi:hypothetical protein
MTGSSCQAAHENGAALNSKVGLFLCLPWVREQGSGHCENLLSSLGQKVLSWARWPLGHSFWEQAVVSLRHVLLEWKDGVWLYHLPGGTMEIRMETQAVPKWRHFCLHISINRCQV